MSDALETELFHNAALGRRLKLKDAMEVLEAMAGEGRLEWADKDKSTAVVYWRKPEEWANAIYDWVGCAAVSGAGRWLTRADRRDGPEELGADAVRDIARRAHDVARCALPRYSRQPPDPQLTGAEFYGMEPTVLRKSLDVLVKRGSAQVFGTTSEEMGVKFF